MLTSLFFSSKLKIVLNYATNIHTMQNKSPMQNNTKVLMQKQSYFNQSTATIILLKRLGTILLHFTRRSTIHGLNHLAQARSAKRRIFWLLISTIATIGFFVNLFYLVEKFIQTPVLTNTFHDYTSFVYPDITFCLVNPINFPPKNTKEYSDLKNVINDFKIKEEPLFEQYYNKSKHEHYLSNMELIDYLFVKENVFYSHQPWSAIIACKYIQYKCSWEDFNIHFIWPYGYCFTFNVTKMKGSLTRDVQTNMKVNAFRPDFRIIIYKAINRLNSFIHDPFNDITKPSGVLAMIHEEDTFPHVSDSFTVDSYTQVDLKIVTKSHLKSLQKCDSTRENYTYCNYRTKQCNTFQGKAIDCLFEIIQNRIALNCNCQMHTMPVLFKNRKLPFCYNLLLDNPATIDTINNCLNYSVRNLSKDTVHLSCYKDLCNHPSYSTVISHSKYPAIHHRQTHLLWLRELAILEDREIAHYGKSDLFLKAVKWNHSEIKKEPNFLNNFTIENKQFRSIKEILREKREDLIDEQFIDQNFMQLRFVPSSLFMDHIEETEEYPLSRLLSDIGGCVGLWVGASLITIFEFFDLLMDLSDMLKIRSTQRRTNGFSQPNCKNPNSNSNNIMNCTKDDDSMMENIENMMMTMMNDGMVNEYRPPICKINSVSSDSDRNNFVLKNMSFDDSTLFDGSESSVDSTHCVLEAVHTELILDV